MTDHDKNEREHMDHLKSASHFAFKNFPWIHSNIEDSELKQRNRIIIYLAGFKIVLRTFLLKIISCFLYSSIKGDLSRAEKFWKRDDKLDLITHTVVEKKCLTTL